VIWFTSDWHFRHKKIIEYSNRPFTCVEHMNEEIIGRCNEKVQEDDVLHNLGDVAFDLGGDLDKIYAIRDKIKCRYIHLVLGNHDKLIAKHSEQLLKDRVFITITNMNTEVHTKPKVVMCHYAMRVWEKSHHGVYSLYGHSHGTLEDDPTLLSFDCGVDTNNYYPYSFNDVTRIMKDKMWAPVDHHDSNTRE
jgi:calcineurin-like phosphoesterase family protein